jgi:hypothetical protein
MPGFTSVFGGTTIAPAPATFLLLAMAADVDLQWPIEQAMSNLVVADTIEVVAANPGLNINLPDARQVSTGYTTLFNNTGVQTVSVRDSQGNTLLSLVSGTAWVIYLNDNSTEAGSWRIFQLGASVSVTNAAALAGAGLKAIATTLNARITTVEKNVTPYAVVNGDRAVSLVWTGGVGTFNLAAAGTVGADWFCYIRNSGGGDLTVTPPAGTIDGAANKTYPSGASSILVCDGVNYYTLGFGGGASGGGSGFDFLVINVPGSGNYVLSGAELNRIGYRFTGILTGTRNIVVPGAIEEYWVDNQTTGAFSLFVKTVAQVPGIEVLQNNRNILYCDGTNVIAAESATVSFPIAVAQGGTGAVTAAAARTNLGATATGAALFTAADAAAARAAISAVPTTRAITVTGPGLVGGGDLSADRNIALAANIPDSESGSYVGSFTGFLAGNQASTIHYRRVGDLVTLAIETFSSTSNQTFMNETSGLMPASIRPSENVESSCFTVVDSGAGAVGSTIVTAAGNLTLKRWGGGGSFFNSGTKGVGGTGSGGTPVCLSYIRNT